MNEAEGGKLPYGVYEDPESKVTEGALEDLVSLSKQPALMSDLSLCSLVRAAIFHKVAVPFVPKFGPLS